MIAIKYYTHHIFQESSLGEWKDGRLHEVFYKSVVKQDSPLVVECLSYGADPNRHFPIVRYLFAFPKT